MRSSATTKHNSAKLTKLLVGLAIAALVIIGGVAWYVVSRPANTTTKNTPSTDTSNNAPSKQDINDTPATNTPSNDIPAATGLAVTITKLSQANGTVTIAGDVTGDGAGAGTCVANFTTTEDHPVSKQATATVSGGKVTCGPINIDEVEFSFLGDWQAKLTYYTTDNKSQVSSESKTITIH